MKGSTTASIVFWALTVAFLTIILTMLMQVFVPGPSVAEATSVAIGRSAAQAAWFQVALNMITLAGLVATVALSLRTVAASTTANIQSREAFVIENRAWVKFTDIHIESDFRWNKESVDGRLRIFYTAKNIGKTVTGPVWIDAMLVSSDPTVAVALPMPGENAIEGRVSHGWEPMGTMLFPNDESHGRFDLQLSSEAIESNGQQIGSITKGDADAWDCPIFVKLVVDAHYDIRFEKKLGFTRRAYEIYRMGASGTLTLRPSNGDVPKAQLILRPALIGSGVAS